MMHAGGGPVDVTIVLARWWREQCKEHVALNPGTTASDYLAQLYPALTGLSSPSFLRVLPRHCAKAARVVTSHGRRLRQQLDHSAELGQRGDAAARHWLTVGGCHEALAQWEEALECSLEAVEQCQSACEGGEIHRAAQLQRLRCERQISAWDQQDAALDALEAEAAGSSSDHQCSGPAAASAAMPPPSPVLRKHHTDISVQTFRSDFACQRVPLILMGLTPTIFGRQGGAGKGGGGEGCGKVESTNVWNCASLSQSPELAGLAVPLKRRVESSCEWARLETVAPSGSSSTTFKEFVSTHAPSLLLNADNADGGCPGGGSGSGSGSEEAQESTQEAPFPKRAKVVVVANPDEGGGCHTNSLHQESPTQNGGAGAAVAAAASQKESQKESGKESGKELLYLHDFGLPCTCPDLCSGLTIPRFFAGDMLQHCTPGSLYREAWPSVFVGPAGSVSDLHVDSFASNFWMLLLQGRKRWTFFKASEAALLYPSWHSGGGSAASLDPVFDPDLFATPVAEQGTSQVYPALAAVTVVWQCVLEAGEVLFVPSGCPHMVENLTDTLALSSNYVDESNVDAAVRELGAQALCDPRAKDLAAQLVEQQVGVTTGAAVPVADLPWEQFKRTQL